MRVVLTWLLGWVSHRLLLSGHHGLTIAHRLLAISHWLLTVTRLRNSTHRLLSVAHWLLTGLHRRHTIPTSIMVHRWLLWGLTTSRHVLHLVVLLHITGHLVIVDLLLKLDKSIVELSVELVALLQHTLKLALCDNSVVKLSKEGCLSGVLVVSVD